MRSKSDFWPTLHQLIRDLKAEGDDGTSRAKSVLQVLDAMPPATQEVYLRNVQFVSLMLMQIAHECRIRAGVARQDAI